MATLSIAPAPFVVQAPDGQVFRFDTADQAAAFEAKIEEGGGTPLRLEPAAAPLPLVARPLYDLEEHLAALADSAELVSPDQEAEYLADFERTLLATREKRDRVGEFLAACEGQAALAQREIERLQKRTALYQAAVERLEGYLTSILHVKGKDAKGKWQKLEGHTHTFGLKNMPPSVAIQDEEAVPAAYKTISITLPAQLWEDLCDSLDLEVRFRAPRRSEVAPQQREQGRRQGGDRRSGPGLPGTAQEPTGSLRGCHSRRHDRGRRHQTGEELSYALPESL